MKDNNKFKVNETTPKSIDLPYLIMQPNQTPKNITKNY